MGDKAAAEPFYQTLLGVKSLDPEYKEVILQALGR